MENKEQIFKKSSTTYYYSSLFFPKDILDKIATIYAYVRVADNFVDDYPQDINGYKQFISQTNKAFRGNEIDKEYKSMLKGKKILLVDDVFTSGADMRECTRVLKRSGATVVWGLALAH